MSTPEPIPTTPPASPQPQTPPTPRGKAAILAIVASVVAGVGAWGAGEFNFGRYDPTLTLELSLSNAMYGLSNSAMVKNAALAYGPFAGLTGLLLGLAGGLASGNLKRGILAGFAGMVVGSALAVLATYGVVPYFKSNYNPDSEDLILPMAVHGAIWLGAGLGGGLGFGLGLGGWNQLGRSILGGLIGSMVGTAAYECLGAFAFATEKTIEPIAQGVGSRGLGYLAVSIGVGVLLAVTLREPPAKTVA